MSSISPLPPPTPPAQKPPRIIKARPPMRQRPYLPPRPSTEKLNSANHASVAPPDPVGKAPELLHKPPKISSGRSVSTEAIPLEPSIPPESVGKAPELLHKPPKIFSGRSVSMEAVPLEPSIPLEPFGKAPELLHKPPKISSGRSVSTEAVPLEPSIPSESVGKAQELLHKPPKSYSGRSVSTEAIPPEPSIPPESSVIPEPVVPSEPVIPTEPLVSPEYAKEDLDSLKHTGNVKKIVGRFDQAVVHQDKEPPHFPVLPEKRSLPQPPKPTRVPRCSSDVALPPPKSKTVNFAINIMENGIEKEVPSISSQGAGGEVDNAKENHCQLEGGSQLDLREDQPHSRHLEHSEEENVNMPNVPSCGSDCPCSCHAKRPGMVMLWVPESEVNSVEDEVATLSDSSSSMDDSPPFRQVFVVNREAPKATKNNSAEDVNGNVANNIHNTKNRTSKTSMALMNKKPFGSSYAVRRHSLTNATDMTNGMKNPGMTNGHHDGSPAEGPSGGNVVLTSFRSVPDRSFSEDDAFLPDTDCKGGLPDSTAVSSTLYGPPCELPPLPATVPKPPRKSKILSQTSLENELPQPPIPPKAPRKPPRTSSASLSFFPRGSLKKKQILEAVEPPVRDSPLCRRPAGKATKGQPSSSSSSNEQKEDFEDSSLDDTSAGEFETNPSDQRGQGLDGAPVTDSASTITSPKSIDWESRLQDEPLYQTYRQTVIRKEIKRQTVPRNCSITSFDVNSECSPTASEYGGNSPRSRRSITPQNTLWQELPAVRESGILNQMSSEERKMQESMFEVLTSEASYLRSLAVLTEHFMESRELDDTIIIREKKILFSNILKVKEVSERFLKDLEERVDESLRITDICDIIYHHSQQNFLVYIDYVRNQVYQEKTYSSLMERNVQFATVITRLQELPQCQRLPFMSFLLLPFQRITRIKMLIENILKRSEEGSVREQNALKALASLSKIIEECNSEVGRMKQMEELIHITKKIEFDKMKAVPIISQARYLEKQGELSEIIQKGSLFGIKPKVIPVYFFLFNDFLLITHRKSSERHVVVDYAHRSLVQVQGCAEYAHGATMENAFFLTLLENHQGKTCDRLFKAPTQSDMHRWMGAFPNKKEPTHSSDETIYEDWDCPQVQCVESYTAMQADELSLEPTDIINILRKTTEGWCEGIRLSDGLKGWFPSKYVQEITNEHVRRRNLRERYRVLQAARHIQVAQPYDPKTKYYST